MSQRALLIVNEKSRRGKEALPDVIEGLREAGITSLHKHCGNREELSDLIARQGHAVDLIIVGGGDGTLNAAAQALTKVRRPLGILPLGTANDLARTLGIPTDLGQAIEVIAARRTRSIDIGLVNDVMFFNVASLGLSTDLSQKLTRDLKSRFGRLGYAFAALRVLAGARPFRAQITCSGRQFSSLTLQIAVGNGRYYGGGNVIHRDASITDKTLRLYSLEFVNAWRIVLMFRSFRAGEHGAFKEVVELSSSQFEVRTRRPRPINADGEIVTQTPASFRVLAKAIDVIVP